MHAKGYTRIFVQKVRVFVRAKRDLDDISAFDALYYDVGVRFITSSSSWSSTSSTSSRGALSSRAAAAAAHRVVDDRVHTHQTRHRRRRRFASHLGDRDRPADTVVIAHQTFDSLKPPRAVRCTRAGLI